MGEYEKLERLKRKFSKQICLMDALSSLMGRNRWVHPFYQHYAPMKRVADKIKGDWWLTKCNTTRLNDLLEAKKYGDKELTAHAYQTSFSHAKAEDAAMWGLYAKNKKSKDIVRITISSKVMKRWVRSINIDSTVGDADERWARIKNLGLNRALPDDVRLVDLRDIVYAATDFRCKDKDCFDHDRYNTICWEGVFAHKLEDLKEDLGNEWVTGLVKDIEWRHERESRLLVSFQKEFDCKKDAIRINVPKFVVKDMRFTFSPWLPEREMDAYIDTIEEAYEAADLDIDDKGGGTFNRFNRSVLQGALNFK